MKSILVLTILMGLLSSCAEKSEITPLFEAKTLSQMEANKLYLSFPIQEIEVESPTRELEEVPVIGGVLRNLADALANLTFKEEYLDLAIAPQTLSIPEIEKLDFSYFKKVQLDSVLLEVAREVEQRDEGLFNQENEDGLSVTGRTNEVRDSRVNLNFIQEIEVYLEPVGELRVDETDRASSPNLSTNESDALESGRPELLLSYIPDRDNLGCQGECLLLKIHRQELKNFLSSFSEYKIHTKVKIKKVPETSMKVRGAINLVIEYDPGF